MQWRSILWGAVAGVAAGVVLWWVISRQLDEQLTTGVEQVATRLGVGRDELQRRLLAGRAELEDAIRAQLEREVPPLVQSQVASTLASYGLTPTTGRRLEQVLALADRMGLI